MGHVQIPGSLCFGTMRLIGADTFGWPETNCLPSRNLQIKQRILRQNVSSKCAELGQIWPKCASLTCLGLYPYDIFISA